MVATWSDLGHTETVCCIKSLFGVTRWPARMAWFRSHWNRKLCIISLSGVTRRPAHGAYRVPTRPDWGHLEAGRQTDPVQTAGHQQGPGQVLRWSYPTLLHQVRLCLRQPLRRPRVLWYWGRHCSCLGRGSGSQYGAQNQWGVFLSCFLSFFLFASVIFSKVRNTSF